MNHEQMQMEFVRKLPIPQEIKKQFPISEKIAQHKAERDEAIRQCLYRRIRQISFNYRPMLRRQ